MGKRRRSERSETKTETPKPPPPPATSDEIRDWFSEDPSRMTMMGARKFNLPEETIVKALKPDWPITVLRVEAFKEIMEALRDLGHVRVFVRSRAAVLEVSGNFRAFTESGGFFNADGDGIDIHIIWRDITGIYAIEKQSHDKPDQRTYSVQFFDKTGTAAFKVFLWENFPAIPPATIDKFHENVEKFSA